MTDEELLAMTPDELRDLIGRAEVALATMSLGPDPSYRHYWFYSVKV